MHICLVSSRNILEKRAWGGVHTHARNLTRLLLEKGHRITFITGRAPSLADGQLTVIPAEQNSRRLQKREWLLRTGAMGTSIHKRDPVHLIISEGIEAAGLTSFSRKNDIPIVAFVHNLHMHYFYNNFKEVTNFRSLAGYLLKSIPRYTHGMLWKDIPFLQKCSRIVTGSSAIAGHLRKYYRLPEDKILTIHNWINTERVDFHMRHRARIRKIHGIGQSARVFLIVGSLWRPKGSYFALKAFEDAVKSDLYQPIYLMFVGDGPERENLEKWIAERDLLKYRVIFTGEIPNEILPCYYSASDIFILPSLLNEVLPYTLLEAMACRLPVIASDISASREILGQSTSLVRRGDTAAMTEAILEKVFSDPVLLKDEGERNRERIKRLFSKQIAAQKIDQLLKDLF